jgi:hypothetical protein
MRVPERDKPRITMGDRDILFSLLQGLVRVIVF